MHMQIKVKDRIVTILKTDFRLIKTPRWRAYLTKWSEMGEHVFYLFGFKYSFSNPWISDFFWFGSNANNESLFKCANSKWKVDILIQHWISCILIKYLFVWASSPLSTIFSHITAVIIKLEEVAVPVKNHVTDKPCHTRCE